MRALLLTLTLSCLTLPWRVEAASLRCGNELASEGSTTVEVRLKCGEPTFRDKRKVVDQEKKTTTSTARTGDKVRMTQSQSATKTVEEWTYNSGPNRLIQVAVFENDRLVEVKSAGYGR